MITYVNVNPDNYVLKGINLDNRILGNLCAVIMLCHMPTARPMKNAELSKTPTS